MKKNTIMALYDYLTTTATTLDAEVVADVAAEVARLNARSNSSAYDEAWEIVKTVLSDGTPRTAKEIFGASENYPEDFSAAKVQYGLLHQWKDKVIKHDNGKEAKTYTLT